MASKYKNNKLLLGADLLRLSRKDLMDLCGPADGIRLYNAIHTRYM